MNPDDLKRRTKEFAVRIVRLCQTLEKDHGDAGRRLGDQLLRSGTGVYANYRAACRCKSRKDFISKIGTIVEEADETLGWLELLVASEVLSANSITSLLKEADEITAIMTASKFSAINNLKNQDK